MNNELNSIEGIGPKTVELLNKLKIYNKSDLLCHYPYRYQVLQRSDVSNLSNNSKVIIDGTIEGQPVLVYLTRGMKKIVFRINSGKNILNIVIYNRPYLISDLKKTIDVTIIGKYDKIRNTIVASEVRLGKLPESPQIESIYYTTSGLSRKSIARFITTLLEEDIDVLDYLPDYIKDKYNFMSKKEAIQEIHNPSSIIMLKKARQRLKYEELFMYLFKINYLKKKLSLDNQYIRRDIDYNKIEEFENNLGFELTIDQNTCIKEILNDMSLEKRMNRLLEGDVGSGKTIVAFIAIYANYLSHYQSALMVPTEILAKQHYEDAIELFKKYKMNIKLLTSSVTKKEKDTILKELETGKIDLIIGTHSLIQDNVIFNNLGLVITDEQHRFGVNQRSIFKNKGVYADILSMSATPIPRTYALTIYGDMDISMITTKPRNRLDVITYFKKEKEIISVLELMKSELDKGHQIYVVAPSIDMEEDSEVENVTALVDKMNLAFGKLYKIGAIHGKLDTKEKNKVMSYYESGKINILVSTTVIEVGVNIPNASMIVIFDANYFGLSTLHQLRGRVGRSDIQSYCILIAKEYEERLKFLSECNDGFKISEYDFKTRGEGDLFGIRQHGEVGLILANINKDYTMLLRVKEDIDEFMDKYFINKEEYSEINSELEKLNLIM